MRRRQNRDNLNIVMLGQKRIPSRAGGVEVVVEELATRMVERGCNVTCYNRNRHYPVDYNEKNGKLKEYKGIRLVDVWTVPKKGWAAVSSSISASICAAVGDYDVAHIHAEGPAFMCWLPKLFGKKVIVTIHGLDHQRAKWGRLASKYIMLGEKNAVKYADEIIVLSKNVQDYFAKKYGRETLFIPNGVNRHENIPAEIITEKWGLKKDEYILFLGRIVPEKGIKYLLEAYKALRTDKKLVIAGGQSDCNGFGKLLKKSAKGNDKIIFTDFVCGKTLEELYSNAYVYVLPSDLEGMPLSLLEAMSYSNCCLTSDIAECREVVEDAALCFEKGNVEDLREKLQMLCDDPMLVEQYKENAAEFVLGKYSWDEVAGKTFNIYGMRVLQDEAREKVERNSHSYVQVQR